MVEIMFFPHNENFCLKSGLVDRRSNHDWKSKALANSRKSVTTVSVCVVLDYFSVSFVIHSHILCL